MPLTKADQKIIVVQTLLNHLFAEFPIIPTIGNSVALWLLEKVTSNHVALDIRDENSLAAIKLTVCLDIQGVQKDYIDKIVDHCYKKAGLFTEANNAINKIDCGIEVTKEYIQGAMTKVVTTDQYCQEEPITEPITFAA